MLIPLTSKVRMYIAIDAPVDAAILVTYAADIALVPDDGSEPGAADWQHADWIGGKASIVVEPGGAHPFTAGDYMAFARVTAGDEKPVLPSGRVRIGLP